MLKFNNININKLNRLSKKLSLLLEPSDIVGFTGDLGAGKTTLIRLL
ncbi:MAG TPA: tRNA (adenosine(37)-N6)-threonylcarbamoyltransferase complex ATPase subunit type 1 TsaE, partial [Bdellovibrionota bacterium]|nr:tRNA (adenosine(37)-N6)-threonylcarbamoyltransferase complex ATPase subunit type 1 TsaE [Bdellovibrionota bacterium]